MKALAIAISLVTLSSLAQAESARAEIERVNTSIGHAMVKKDFKGLDKIMKSHMTSDFKYTEAGQTQTYDQMFANIKQGLGMYSKVTKAKATIKTFKQKGNSAWALTSHSMAGTVMGQDKKPHKMTFNGDAAETYVKQGKTWKMSKMEWGKNAMLMDGKPFDPSKMGGK